MASALARMPAESIAIRLLGIESDDAAPDLLADAGGRMPMPECAGRAQAPGKAEQAATPMAS